MKKLGAKIRGPKNPDAADDRFYKKIKERKIFTRSEDNG